VHVLACPWAPVIDALKEHGNNKSQTAKTLGITREGLHKKLKGFGIG
jgi:Nif-specific regulatory protein